jgi:hypothetical protein
MSVVKFYGLVGSESCRIELVLLPAVLYGSMGSFDFVGRFASRIAQLRSG